MTNLKKGIGIVGSTTIDTIVTRDRSYLKLGGVTTYAGNTYRRYGISTHVVSNFSVRDRMIMDKFAAENIKVLRSKGDQTTHFVNDIRGQTRHQKVLQLAAPIDRRQIQSIIDRIDGLHLGPLHPLDIDPSALPALRNLNLKIFLDIQGYTRMIQNQIVYSSISEHLTEGLNAAQLIKANGSENQSMLNHYQMSLVDLMHTFNIEEAVITLGKKGGFVQKKDGESVRYAAEEVKDRLDTTGAGDVFFAAYVAARLSSRMQIPDACRHAARIAAQQVEGKHLTIDHLGLG